MKTLQELRTEQAKLQREAIAIHRQAQAGEQSALARRSELLASIEFLAVQIAEAEAAESIERGNARIRQAKDAASANAEFTANIKEILDRRSKLADEAQDLAAALAETLRMLIQLHRAAGDQVRRCMPVDEATGLDTDEIGVVRSVLSTLFDIGGIDSDEAVRSLGSLNFGIQRRTEDVRSTVGHQNQILLSIRERSDRRWADYVAELEAPKEAA